MKEDKLQRIKHCDHGIPLSHCPHCFRRRCRHRLHRPSDGSHPRDHRRRRV